MTPFQKFKETTYQQMLGKHHAHFMIECFYLDEESYTLMVNYTKGKELDISVDPEEYHDVYAFERELRDKQVIGHIPEKVSPILYTLIENHMNEFVYVNKDIPEFTNLSEGLVHKLLGKSVIERENIYIILKSNAEQIRIPGPYGITYPVPSSPLNTSIMELLK